MSSARITFAKVHHSFKPFLDMQKAFNNQYNTNMNDQYKTVDEISVHYLKLSISYCPFKRLKMCYLTLILIILSGHYQRNLNSDVSTERLKLITGVVYQTQATIKKCIQIMRTTVLN